MVNEHKYNDKLGGLNCHLSADGINDFMLVILVEKNLEATSFLNYTRKHIIIK